MKKRNLKNIPEAQIMEETDHEGKIINLPPADEYSFLFYHSPQFRVLYIFSFDPNDTHSLPKGVTWPQQFAEIFPKAVNVTQRKFDTLYKLHPDAQVVPVGMDYILDKHLPDEAGNKD